MNSVYLDTIQLIALVFLREATNSREQKAMSHVIHVISNVDFFFSLLQLLSLFCFTV